MAEYIKRDVVMKEIMAAKWMDGYDGATAMAIAASAPAADVAPVRHGEWQYGDYYDIGDVCSECDWDSEMTHPSYRYCPNCGAKMDER